MMRCKQAQQWISADADNEADTAKREIVLGHISECDQCRAFAADVAILTNQLCLLESPQPQPGFSGGVLARISNEPKQAFVPGGWWDWFRPARLCMGVASFAVGMFLVGLVDAKTEPPLRTGGMSGVSFTTRIDMLVADRPIERVLLSLMAEVEE